VPAAARATRATAARARRPRPAGCAGARSSRPHLAAAGAGRVVEGDALDERAQRRALLLPRFDDVGHDRPAGVAELAAERVAQRLLRGAGQEPRVAREGRGELGLAIERDGGKRAVRVDGPPVSVRRAVFPDPVELLEREANAVEHLVADAADR